MRPTRGVHAVTLGACSPWPAAPTFIGMPTFPCHGLCGHLLAAFGCVSVLAALTLATGGANAYHARVDSPRERTVPRPHRVDRGERPNIVFVLADDFSMDLLRHMRDVRTLERRGLSFDDYFV